MTDDSSLGFCECPSQQVVAVSTGNGVSTTEIRPFILVEDPHYSEQMCVPVVTYNESCFYDAQCKATDWNLFCKQIIREDGLPTSDLICDCISGYNWDSKDGTTKKCLATSSENAQKQESLNETVTNTTENGPSDQETTTGNRELVIWWIFRPTETTGKCDNQKTSSRLSKCILFCSFSARIFEPWTLLLQLSLPDINKLCLCFSSFCYHFAGCFNISDSIVLLSTQVGSVTAVPTTTNFLH